MNFYDNKENLSINRMVGQKKERFNVQGDVIVPDIKPDILNIINATGNICINKKEVLDGKAKIDGEVMIYVMYYPDSENDTVRALNTTISFSRIIEIEKSNEKMFLQSDMQIQEIECKILNGRKLNINCELEARLKTFSNEEISIIKNVEDDKNIQTLISKLKIDSLVGKGETKITGKENIKIDKGDVVAEILDVGINIGNKDVKISYNKVITKAEAEVRILYLTEDNRICLVENKIPVMGFVDMQNVSDEHMCETRYDLKNFQIKVNPEEEYSIYTEIEVTVYCNVYKNNEIEVLQDMYSRKENLTFTQKTVNAISSKNIVQDVCEIRERISIPELEVAHIHDASVVPIIETRDIVNEKIMYHGHLNIKFVYSQINMSNNAQETNIKEYDLPFDFSTECAKIDKTYEVEESIEIPMHDFIIMQGGDIEAKIDLIFNMSIEKNENINILENINVEEDNSNKYSMTIYFVKPGDTLWKIAKRFKSTVKDILRVNEIENENKIQIGQQLFLPR